MPTQKEISDQLKLLETLQQTLHYLLQQKARLGISHTPPSVLHDITDTENSIQQIENKLKEWSIDAGTRINEPKDKSTNNYTNILVEANIINNISNLEASNFSSSTIIQYLIIGITNSDIIPLIKLFKAEEDPKKSDTVDSEDIVFDNAEEYREIFASLNKIISLANQAENGKKQEAFDKAWKEEVITRASAFAFDEDFRYSAFPEGIKYVVYGFRKDYAHLIRLLRCEHLVEQPKVIERDAVEMVYYDLDSATNTFETIVSVIRESQGNRQLFLKKLFEAAMRTRAGI